MAYPNGAPEFITICGAAGGVNTDAYMSYYPNMTDADLHTFTGLTYDVQDLDANQMHYAFYNGSDYLNFETGGTYANSYAIASIIYSSNIKYLALNTDKLEKEEMPGIKIYHYARNLFDENNTKINLRIKQYKTYLLSAEWKSQNSIELTFNAPFYSMILSNGAALRYYTDTIMHIYNNYLPDICAGTFGTINNDRSRVVITFPDTNDFGLGSYVYTYSAGDSSTYTEPTTVLSNSSNILDTGLINYSDESVSEYCTIPHFGSGSNISVTCSSNQILVSYYTGNAVDPTLSYNASSKVLSWTNDAKQINGYQLEWSTDSSFANPTTIKLGANISSYDCSSFYGTWYFRLKALGSLDSYYSNILDITGVARMKEYDLYNLGTSYYYEAYYTFTYYPDSAYSATQTITNPVGYPIITLNPVSSSPDKLAASWTGGSGATYWSWCDNDQNPSWSALSTSQSTIITASKSGALTVSVIGYNGTDTTSHSDTAVAGWTLNAIPSPYNLAIERTGVNTGTLTWTSSFVDTTDTIYKVYLNNVLQGSTNNTSYSLVNIPAGSNTFSVMQEYTPNSNFNSSTTTLTSEAFSKLATPTMLKTDITGNVYLIDQGANGWEYVLDSNGDKILVSDSGTTGTTFKLSSSDGYTGMQFKFYEDLDGTITTDIDPQDSAHKNYVEKSIGLINRELTFGSVGSHKVYGQLIYPDDTSYNSDLSNEVAYSVNTLAAPVLLWGDDAGLTSSKIYQSEITWLPVTTTTTSGNYANYYYVDLIGDNVAAGSLVTVAQPSDLTARVGTWIPDPDPVTGQTNGLLSSLPATSTTYTVRVRAASYNAWYVGGSAASTATYQINKLETPQNISWDADTLTLSWDAVTNANTYYVYDNNTKIQTVTGTSYTFTTLESGLHQFYVVAAQITTEEVTE